MRVDFFEIANVLIVIGLLLVLRRKRDATTQLLILLTYGSLHFSFSVLALGADGFAHLLTVMHNQGGGLLATLSTLTLLGIVFTLLGSRVYDAFTVSSRSYRRVAFIFLSAMGFLLVAYIFNFRSGDWLQFKNVMSMEVMLILMLIGFVCIVDAPSVDVKTLYPWGIWGLFLLGFANIISIFEVLSKRSWAGTYQSSGTMVYRASSILFNPNLYGFWASLIYIGCSFGLLRYPERWKMTVGGMLLASIGIYLSGARSDAYLLLLVSAVAFILLKGKLRWVPLVLLPITLLTMYSGAKLINALMGDDCSGGRSLALLGERFIDAPIYLIKYAMLSYEALGKSGAYIANIFSTDVKEWLSVPIEVHVAISGRFEGSGRDSGWFVLYQDAGWFGLAAILLLCLILAIVAIRAYIRDPSASSAYAFAMLAYCVLSGLVMRFQIFPVWLFIGIALIPGLVYWNRTAFLVRGREK